MKRRYFVRVGWFRGAISDWAADEAIKKKSQNQYNTLQGQQGGIRKLPPATSGDWILVDLFGLHKNPPQRPPRIPTSSPTSSFSPPHCTLYPPDVCHTLYNRIAPIFRTNSISWNAHLYPNNWLKDIPQPAPNYYSCSIQGFHQQHRTQHDKQWTYTNTAHINMLWHQDWAKIRTNDAKQ